jgi:hemerythrin
MSIFISWVEELSVGIEEIDEQHKVLIELLNTMNEAIEQRRSREKSSEILNKLIEYAKIHFAVEESLMRIMGYPEYEEHKQKHEELMKTIFDLVSKVEKGSIAIGFELQYFLKNWLTKHILDTDKQYAEYFINSGIKPKLKKSSWMTKLWE